MEGKLRRLTEAASGITHLRLPGNNTQLIGPVPLHQHRWSDSMCSITQGKIIFRSKAVRPLDGFLFEHTVTAEAKAVTPKQNIITISSRQYQR